MLKSYYLLLYKLYVLSWYSCGNNKNGWGMGYCVVGERAVLVHDLLLIEALPPFSKNTKLCLLLCWLLKIYNRIVYLFCTFFFFVLASGLVHITLSLPLFYAHVSKWAGLLKDCKGNDLLFYLTPPAPFFTVSQLSKQAQQETIYRNRNTNQETAWNKNIQVTLLYMPLWWFHG